MLLRKFLLAGCVLSLGACATLPQVEPKDYTAFNTEAPRSILVVPVINHTNEVDAANLFLTTMTVPLSERGFYVFPINATRNLMEAEGLGDAGLVHGTQTSTLAEVFDADALMYVEVLKWETNYNVFNSDVQTEMLYTLKSGRTNEVLWQDQQSYLHSYSANSGNIFADLIATAISAAIDSTRSDFTPVATSANNVVISPAGVGVPFGPYSPQYGSNAEIFPSTGSGRVTNSTQEATAAPGLKAREDVGDPEAGQGQEKERGPEAKD